MNRKISLGAAISFMAVVAAITFTITMIFSLNIFNEKVSNVTQREDEYKKIAEVDQIIRQNYIGEIDEDGLFVGVAKGFVNGIHDKYAAYYDAATYKKLQQIRNGSYVGIGAGLSKDESGYLRVSALYEESPAASAGLQEGDLIISVNGTDVKSLGYDAAIDAMMGEPGTNVALTYRRNSVDADCTVLIKKFDLPVVTMTTDGGNAYVRISEFSSAAVTQFVHIINTIKSDDSITGIVFDLRGTSKGDLDSACDMLDLLLPGGDLLTATYKDGTTKLLRNSDVNEVSIPMTVLVNSKTQYAAELFAADMRDYDKAKLIGAKTYGQGVITQDYQLKDGSCIVLSSATYTPAVSPSFDQTGLTPDYEVSLTADLEKALTYHQLSAQDDTQLAKAIEVLNALK